MTYTRSVPCEKECGQRTRTRHAERLSDLQKRVREHELQSVAASQELQRAARKVVQENIVLREVLARKGVQKDEVDAYLRSEDAGAGLASTNSSRNTDSGRVAESAQSMDSSDKKTHSGSSSEAHLQGRPLPASAARKEATPRLGIESLPPVLQTSETAPCSQDLDVCRDTTQVCSYEDPSCCQNGMDCFCPPDPTRASYPSDKGLEISCETATNIIIGMRGDNDRDAVRASLGCTGRDDCNVKNTVVLQVMDQG